MKRTFRIGTYRELRANGFVAEAALYYARRARTSQLMRLGR